MNIPHNIFFNMRSSRRLERESVGNVFRWQIMYSCGGTTDNSNSRACVRIRIHPHSIHTTLFKKQMKLKKEWCNKTKTGDLLSTEWTVLETFTVPNVKRKWQTPIHNIKLRRQVFSYSAVKHHADNNVMNVRTLVLIPRPDTYLINCFCYNGFTLYHLNPSLMHYIEWQQTFS